MLRPRGRHEQSGIAQGKQVGRGQVLDPVTLAPRARAGKNDKVAADVRKQLGESPASIQRFSKPLFPGRAPSLEALKAYADLKDDESLNNALQVPAMDLDRMSRWASSGVVADRVILLADGRLVGTLEAPSADAVAEQLAHLGD